MPGGEAPKAAPRSAKKGSAWNQALGYVPFLVFAAVVGGSIYWRWMPGIEAGLNFRQFLAEMLLILPPAFLLIGLVDVWVSRETIEKQVGTGSGIKGILWVTMLAMFQAGPLYVAFPVAYMLWKKGSSMRNVFIYLSSFSAMKFPMLTFEVGFMGIRFSITRLAFTLPVFIGVGVLMDKLMGENYFLKNGNPALGAGWREPVPGGGR
jgi:uncharacterized membrane protein YraQ (UPF0718 family)